MTDPAPSGLVLVTGANGFLGSHVVQELVRRGRSVRAFVRPSADLRAIASLPVEQVYGDIRDADAVALAVKGCTSIIHCAVNTQAWLRNTAPMFEVNVKGMCHVAEAALREQVRRFVLTSTIATIGRNPSGISTEEDPCNYLDKGGPYVRCRAEAEERFFAYVRDGLPGIAMNVANTYGPGDYRPTPHGRLLLAAAAGRLPFVLNAGMACVGIEDAARAMVLAEEHGTPGSRYIVSERWLSQRQLYEAAMAAAGVRRRLHTIPLAVAYSMGFVADCISRLSGRDNQLSVQSVRLSHIMNDMDAAKARRELGWHPGATLDVVRAAVAFYKAEGMLS